MSSLEEAAAAWRDCKTAEEFCDRFELPTDVMVNIKSLKDPYAPLSSALLAYMKTYFGIVKTFKEVISLRRNLEFLERTDCADHDDTLMKILISCLRQTGQIFPSADRGQIFADALRQHLPEIKTKTRAQEIAQKKLEDSQKQLKLLRDAFHTQELGTANVSEALWRKICSYYRQYNPSRYFSPYTSIVGPSGIGKSFAVQSMARKGLTYVVYVSLAGPQASSYPRRSYFARYLTSDLSSDYSNDDRAKLTIEIEAFIAASIRQVKLCRRYKINTSDYFTMQVYDDSKHKEIHGRLSEALDSLRLRALNSGGVTRIGKTSNRRRDFKSDEHKGSFDYGEYLDDELAQYETDVEPIFKEYAKSPKDMDGSIPELTTDEPNILFCLDEARALLVPSDLAFVSFRRAMRHQQMNGVSRGIQEYKNIFAVLLDTCAKFNVFVPPRAFDPSAKLTGGPVKQFTPIWEIASHDSLATGPHTIRNLSTLKPGDNDWDRRLFTFGRPNWASQLRIGGIRGLVDHATKKMYGGTDTEELTADTLTSMLAFRLQFYVVSHHLGESLVSGYLRMIYDMSDDRLKLRTIQPSEPILAWVAQQEMDIKPGCKVAVLQNFYKQCSSGSIDSGDIGEMVASLILMFAFDRKQSLDMNGPMPQTVFNFVQNLFGAQETAKLSSEQTGKHVARFMDGLVFFNHFTRLEGPVNLDVLRQAWGRGTALFSYPGTAHFDIIIPVAMLKDNKMSFIVIQVKNRQDDRLNNGLKIEAESIISSAVQALPQTSAYMGILMALRTRGKPEVMVTVEPSNNRKRKSFLKEDKNRVMVVALGLDRKIYAGMASESEECEEICRILRDLLDLKGNIKASQETDYQKNFAVGYK